ncbi:MAG: methylenetetrahydrofolate reductase C-terminal domain-containing protein [Parvularculaceae bacterium]
MYAVRLWATRHARLLERIYDAAYGPTIATLKSVDRVFGRRADKPVAAVEAAAKGFMFDCKMCGECLLSKTGMTCPMNCPKEIRNGPCGGVRDDGMCEVKPDMRCVWVEAWNGAAHMKKGDAINDVNFAIDHRIVGTSSWLRLARNE